jgi:hypothetical protein
MDTFPNGEHDDQIDAVSGGMNALAQDSAGDVMEYYRRKAEELKQAKEKR